ncbi:MAG TPA: alpha-galactosidase [Gemmatimonadales bacterium]|jgi:hypothetical protein|nr:alpha-galactosidase [Gemmatimonadales bacterium]
MDRRTFVLLTGTVSGGLLRPRGVARLAPPRGTREGTGRLRFELDEHRRWTLWYYGEAQPVPLIRAAEVVAWVGDEPLTLADLQDSTVGSRRPPGGEAVVVRGRAAAVWVEAEFLAADAAATPLAAITVTIFPDRNLPTVKGVRFCRVAAADVLPGEEPLVALLNGYHSRAACRVVAVAEIGAEAATSHGALGLGRGTRGLGVAFDAGEPGEAQVRVSRDGLEAVSDWLPSRPLRPAGDAARMRLAYQPAGDALEALHTAFLPSSPLDQERLAQAVALAGWSSEPGRAGEVTEADVVANLEFCAAHFDRRFFRHIRLADGYQKAAGDWDTNARFPHGHRWLTDQVHAAGFTAGLWVAPLTVAERSGIAAAHPDWLLQDGTGPIGGDTRAAWGGKLYTLDGAHPKVQAWLFTLARQAVRDWGYDALDIDILLPAMGGATHYGGLTHAEAYRAGLAALRDGLGTEALLLGTGAPLQHAAGLVNGMRIGPDVGPSWSAVQPAARAAALRGFYHRATWLNDPDRLVVRPPLSLSEARAWASLVAVSGGVTMFSDHLPGLAPERLALLERTLPVAPVVARAVGAMTLERDPAPAITLGDVAYAIRGPWRFRTGDDPRYGTREFDEEAWETIVVPGRWDAAGHRDYDGFGWYRVRFPLPTPTLSSGTAPARSVALELGKIAEADETFVNGVRVGQTGDFPPTARGEGDAYRRYALPAELVNWGGENVLAVRVYAGGSSGGGGLWSVERERPPRAWVVEGAPRWWTVMLVNWEDEPQPLAQPLAALGIPGATFAAYDVWRDRPLADPTGTLALTLEPRSAFTVALRPTTPHPQVIGTSRHVVQGAVDLADETWDPTTRVLRARSVNLDHRAYAVTIAVPAGLRPGACRADVSCRVTRLESGHVVLEWAAGGDGRDLQWELGFHATPGPRKSRH